MSGFRTTTDGLDSFALAVGLRAQDMYGTCAALFCCIAGGIILVSLLVWIIHALIDVLVWSNHGQRTSTGPLPQRSTHVQAATVADTSTRSKKSSEAFPSDTSAYQLSTLAHHPRPFADDETDSSPATPSAEHAPQGHSLLPFGPGIASSNAGVVRASKWKKAWAKFKIKGPVGAFHYAALRGM